VLKYTTNTIISWFKGLGNFCHFNNWDCCSYLERGIVNERACRGRFGSARWWTLFLAESVIGLAFSGTSGGFEACPSRQPVLIIILFLRYRFLPIPDLTADTLRSSQSSYLAQRFSLETDERCASRISPYQECLVGRNLCSIHFLNFADESLQMHLPTTVRPWSSNAHHWSNILRCNPRHIPTSHPTRSTRCLQEVRSLRSL